MRFQAAPYRIWNRVNNESTQSDGSVCIKHLRKNVPLRDKWDRLRMCSATSHFVDLGDLALFVALSERKPLLRLDPIRQQPA
jgi:hypothetical protein